MIRGGLFCLLASISCGLMPENLTGTQGLVEEGSQELGPERQSPERTSPLPALDSGAWLRLAKEAEENGDWQKVGVCLDSFLGSRTPTNHWLERRINAAEMAENWQECALFQGDLLHREPEHLELRIGFCATLQRLGRGNEGVMHMEYEVRKPNHRETALRVILLLQERDQRWLDAAMTAERLAKDTSLEDYRLLFLRASRLREKSGDMQGAVKDMELALQGIRLSPGEERLLSRLRALESGEIQNVANALLILRQHEYADYRYRAILYLADESFPRDAEVFARALGDQDLRVIRLAIQELAHRGGKDCAVDFVPLCSHDDRGVRIDALGALAKRGTLAELPAVLNAMDPLDREIFRAARKSLEEISNHAIGLSLDPELEERQALVAAWQEWIFAHEP